MSFDHTAAPSKANLKRRVTRAFEATAAASDMADHIRCAAINENLSKQCLAVEIRLAEAHRALHEAKRILQERT